MKQIKYIAVFASLAMIFLSCKEGAKSELQQKVESYAVCEIGPDYIKDYKPHCKKVLNLFRKAADQADSIFWLQTFGDRAKLNTLKGDEKEYALINYGVWDRLDDNKLFVEGYGERPAVANYYPQDMTQQEWDNFDDPNKLSPYTIITRDENGKLKCVWYHEAYKKHIDKMCAYLLEAKELVPQQSIKDYLSKRVEALQTSKYFDSDLVWMDMKDAHVDLVIGPIEDYDDGLNGLKTSFESFILLKDKEKTAKLEKFVQMLPEIQKNLPCKPEYKTFVPGTESDMFVYDVIYYAGDCNSSSKTIAINLPNDPKVQALKGTRRLQLANAIEAKFEKILVPIGNILLDPSQREYLDGDAFFWNVTFHEVAHGLGVKETVNGKGSVDSALGKDNSAWEEGKADILGLHIVSKLIDKGDITNITKEQAITTYIASLVRSVRFGVGEAHGIANIMCYNFLEENGAFTRDPKTGYHKVNFEKAGQVIDKWAEFIISLQATGNSQLSKDYMSKNAVIKEGLQEDLKKINSSNVPVDIKFEFTW